MIKRSDVSLLQLNSCHSDEKDRLFHDFSWTHAEKSVNSYLHGTTSKWKFKSVPIWINLPTYMYVPANSVFEIFIACRYYKVGSTQLKYIRYWFCLQKSVVKLDIWDMSCMYVGMCVNKGYGHTVRCVTNTLHELVQFHCGSKCACMDVCTSSHMRTSGLRLWHQTTVNTGCCRVFMEPVP